MVLTNWVAEVWAYEVWEAFDTWRLWWLPPRVRDAIDDLDMYAVLGSDGVEDAKRAVRLLRETEWNLVPRENQARMRIVKNWSPRRDGSAGDFIWVNPYEWRPVPGAVARGARARPYGSATPFPRARGLNLRRGSGVGEEPRRFPAHGGATPSVVERSPSPVTGTCPKGQKSPAVAAASQVFPFVRRRWRAGKRPSR